MRSRLALGTLFVAVTVSLTVTVTGLAGLSDVPGVRGAADLLAPPAAAAELVPFADCDELLGWFVEQALPEVGPYGLGGWPVVALAEGGATLDSATVRGNAGVPEAATSTETGQSSSGTGTNVQEVGVDEPDRAKTDGSLVVHLRDHDLVVTDVRGPAPREVGSLRLPRTLAGAELLLSGETVLVVGPQSTGGWGGPIMTDLPVGTSMPFPGYPVDENSRVLEVSIADPTAPRVVSDQTFGGSLLSARQHGTTVRLVLSTSAPVLDFVQPNRERTPKESTEENRQILRDSLIEDWLPTLRSGDGDPEPLVGCEDVSHPDTGAGYGTVTVVTLDAATPTDLSTLGVTTSGQTVYSSTDRLYLTTWSNGNSTEVHAFALDGATTSYAASGTVRGVLEDRWSMDEHDGVLRLALAHGPGWWSPEENGITTLRERGDELEVVGSVRGLGPDEQIKSVRWFDDLAIVVTFRQTDPLYTVDLSDPADPRTLGELKIPGFSEYLHPIGDDRLLGLGQDATQQGQVLGGQASLFDVSDLADPQRVDTLPLGAHAYPSASQDPRTFTWLPEDELGLAVIEDSWTGRASLVELLVADDGTLAEGRSWSLPRWGAYQGRALPLADGRVAVVGSSVEVVQLG